MSAFVVLVWFFNTVQTQWLGRCLQNDHFRVKWDRKS